MALCLTAAVVSGCRQEAEQPQVQNAAAVERSETRLPVVEPPMDRAGLLKAVGAAASAGALGQDDADAQRKLDGKKFEVRIRFGCATSAPPGVRAQRSQGIAVRDHDAHSTSTWPSTSSAGAAVAFMA